MKTEWPRWEVQKLQKKPPIFINFLSQQKVVFRFPPKPRDFSKKTEFSKSRRNLETTPPQPCLAFARKANIPMCWDGGFSDGLVIWVSYKNKTPQTKSPQKFGGFRRSLWDFQTKVLGTWHGQKIFHEVFLPRHGTWVSMSWLPLMLQVFDIPGFGN